MLPDTLSDLTSLIAILNPQERQSDLFPLGHTIVDEEVGCPFSEKAELGRLEVMTWRSCQGVLEMSPTADIVRTHVLERGCQEASFLLSHSALQSNTLASIFIILLWYN